MEGGLAQQRLAKAKPQSFPRPPALSAERAVERSPFQFPLVIDNQSQMTAAQPSHAFAIPLDSLEVGKRARMASIDWASLAESEASRLRHFGFDEGVAIEA